MRSSENATFFKRIEGYIMNDSYDKTIEEASDRNILNDIETPENKLLLETLEQLEEKDYLERFVEETDYDNFQNKCDHYVDSDFGDRK